MSNYYSCYINHPSSNSTLFLPFKIHLQLLELLLSVFIMRLQSLHSLLKRPILPLHQPQVRIILVPAEIEQLGPELSKPRHHLLLRLLQLQLQSVFQICQLLSQFTRLPLYLP